VDLVNSVLIRYKRGKKPVFVMSQLAFGAIQKLKDSTGQPLLLRDLTAPNKYVLMGYEVEITDTFGQADTAATDFIIF
jgi:HK97 family phage major capsid protein